MLSEEKSMQIHKAYDLTGSFRATAALCGVDHHTVRRHVAARAVGLDPASELERPKVSDPYLAKIEEWVERSEGFYRLVDAAYEQRSLAVSSNLHPSGFDQLMGKSIATALVDRLLHHAHIVETSGESIRLQDATSGRRVKPLDH